MKTLLIGLAIASMCTACGNDSGTGNDDKNMGTINDSTTIDTGLQSSDTTATTNNNAYNTDSASGQGNRYDTSNQK